MAMTIKPRYPVEVTLDMIPLAAKEARRLERAVRIIRRVGWCQGQLMDRRGRVCAVKAYQLAATEGEYPDGGHGLLAVSIVLNTDLTVAQWNDGNGRTQSEVIAAFETAARELMAVANRAD